MDLLTNYEDTDNLESSPEPQNQFQVSGPISSSKIANVTNTSLEDEWDSFSKMISGVSSSESCDNPHTDTTEQNNHYLVGSGVAYPASLCNRETRTPINVPYQVEKTTFDPPLQPVVYPDAAFPRSPNKDPANVKSNKISESVSKQQIMLLDPNKLERSSSSSSISSSDYKVHSMSEDSQSLDGPPDLTVQPDNCNTLVESDSEPPKLMRETSKSPSPFRCNSDVKPKPPLNTLPSTSREDYSNRSRSHSRDSFADKNGSPSRSKSQNVSRDSSKSTIEDKQRSSSRELSKSNSKSRSRSRSVSSTKYVSRNKTRTKTRSRSRHRSRSKSRHVSKSTSRRHSHSRSRRRHTESKSKRHDSGSRSKRRSRSRSKHRSGTKFKRSKNRSRSQSRHHSKSKSRHRSRSRSKSKSRHRSRSRSKSKSRHRSQSRSKSKSRHRSRSRSKSKGRHHSSPSSKHKRHRSRSKSRDRYGRKSKDKKKRSRSRSRKRIYHRSRSRDRCSRSKSRSRSRSRSKRKTFREVMRQQLLTTGRLLDAAADGSINKSGLQLDAKKVFAELSSCCSNVTPQVALLQTMAAMHKKAQEITGVAVPKYYNPAAVNPLKYAEQIQKRKLLWSKSKGVNDEKETQWQPPTNFSSDQDQDGKATAKFRRLMGIKESDCDQQEQTDEQKLRQTELFSRLDKEYEFARMTTHTHRGVGLGFSSQIYNPNLTNPGS